MPRVWLMATAPGGGNNNSVNRRSNSCCPLVRSRITSWESPRPPASRPQRCTACRSSQSAIRLFVSAQATAVSRHHSPKSEGKELLCNRSQTSLARISNPSFIRVSEKTLEQNRLLDVRSLFQPGARLTDGFAWEPGRVPRRIGACPQPIVEPVPPLFIAQRFEGFGEQSDRQPVQIIHSERGTQTGHQFMQSVEESRQIIGR